MGQVRTVAAGDLIVAYEEHGPPDAEAVVLLHGFPYSPRAFDAVAVRLSAEGCRVLVPYLRGHGPTRFASGSILRSGQQAALASDLLAFMDALDLQRPLLMGFDWGGRAACIVAALWPERVRGLISVGGYNIHDIARLSGPLPPEMEHRLWYQTYLNTERGARAFPTVKAGLCELLWRLWSPNWTFTGETFADSAAAFDNPDFDAVVIHSYRHRCGTAAGDPHYDAIEQALAAQPTISVPTIALWGEADGVMPMGLAEREAAKFTGPFERRMLPGVGHNPAQEAPDETCEAILFMLKGGRA